MLIAKQEILFNRKQFKIYLKFFRSTPIKAFLYDYSFLIQALLDLYEMNFDQELLIFVDELQTLMHKIFYDNKQELYFFNRSSDKTIIVPLKDGIFQFIFYF